MSHDREREEALARLLEELTDPVGGLDASAAGDTVEDEELRELVSLAASVGEQPVTTPRDAFRDELRDRLLAEVGAVPEAASDATAIAPLAPVAWLRERFERVKRSVGLAIASVVTAGALGGVGVAVAAENAQPDDLLYPIKRWTETVRLTLADDDEALGSLQLSFAERRLAELSAGVHDIQVDRQIALLAEMDDHTVHGGNELLDAYDQTGNIDHLRTLAGFIGRQRTGLRSIRDRAAVAVVPAIDTSLRVVDTLEDDATSQALRGCLPCREGTSGDRCCPQTPAGGTTEESDPRLTPGSAPTGGTGSGIIPSAPATGGSVVPGLPTETPSLPVEVPSGLPTTTSPLPSLSPTLPQVPSVSPTPDVPSPGVTESVPDATESVGDTVGGATESVGDAVDGATGGLVGDGD